jgi:hypothetical protein
MTLAYRDAAAALRKPTADSLPSRKPIKTFESSKYLPFISYPAYYFYAVTAESIFPFESSEKIHDRYGGGIFSPI